MDAAWMMNYIDVSYFMIVPTIFSGLMLVYLERQLSGRFISLAIVFWCTMNSLWLFSETQQVLEYLFYAKISFICGIVCLILGMYFSAKPLMVLSRFARSSIKSFKD
jgi:hypothetical protein